MDIIISFCREPEHLREIKILKEEIIALETERSQLCTQIKDLLNRV